MKEKKLIKKACFVCNEIVEPEKYAVHYAFGAIICSPQCFKICEDAAQEALMENIKKSMEHSYVGNSPIVWEEEDGK